MAWSVCRFGLGITIFCSSLGLAHGENWPQWRGARLDGVSGETSAPLRWSRTENVAWRLPLPGPGGSTPVVWDDHIFLTSVEDEDLVLLAATTDGKELWKRKIGTGNREARGDEGNSASPSPSTDGRHVWAMMGTGELACYDLEGDEVWAFNLQNRYGAFDIQFGMSSTPVLDGDRLYLQLIHSGGAKVVALDKATGEEVWQVPRPSDAYDECKHSYASPVLYRDDQREFLLTHGADYIVAHNLEDGRELWRQGGLNPRGRYENTLRFVASPVTVPGLIVVPSAKNGPVLGVKPDGQLAWKLPGDTPDVPSPLIAGGLVYLCGADGILMCLDGDTGKEHYGEKRAYSDRYRASPVYAAGRVYLTSRDGTVTVIKAGPNFESLAENSLGEDISSSPVFSNGTLYLRSFEALYAIREQK